MVSYKEKTNVCESVTISSSADAGKVLFEDWNKNTIELQETFKIILLNNSNKVKGIYVVSSGGNCVEDFLDIRVRRNDRLDRFLNFRIGRATDKQ